ncbi:helix-turn-helix transcriptional regulator [Enterococcus devriesei]|uniref:helix-turn-helix domain-containing protein n=1 Tax=Enterococcus devriesei TaxID=319970 RepID=UPI0028E7F858|nr:helix-turn-helix transcriptional regulator [Enterococcus devriesei]
MIENFGGNVARLRKEHGLSQEEMAEKVGVNKQTISNIERGVRYPTFETLEKIAKVLKAGPIQLFGTMKEIAISDTENVVDRIDDYEDRVQAMMRFAKVFDEQYLKEIDAAFHKTQYIHQLFTAQPIHDEEGNILVNDSGEKEMTPAFFETIPFDQIDNLVKKIDYIKDNKKLL